MRPGGGIERILDAACLEEVREGEIDLAFAIVDDAAIRIGARRVRIERDGGAEIGQRAIEIAAVVEGRSALAVEFGIGRLFGVGWLGAWRALGLASRRDRRSATLGLLSSIIARIPRGDHGSARRHRELF